MGHPSDLLYDDEPRRGSADKELVKSLEKAASKLEGVRREQFVDERSLCGSCQYAQIMRRASKNHRVIHCGVYGKDVPEDIVECSDYKTFMGLSLQQMAQMATLIDPRDYLKEGYR